MVVEYIIPATILASSIAMLYTSFKISFGEPSPKIEVKEEGQTNYRMLVKELEVRRELIRNAILNVYKQYEDGKISESVKNVLVDKFERELTEVEERLSKLREYAELERLREEYENLIKEFENKKRTLEKRINELERKLKPKKKEVKKEEEKKEKEDKKQKREEDTLEDILREVSKIIEEYGVE